MSERWVELERLFIRQANKHTAETEEASATPLAVASRRVAELEQRCQPVAKLLETVAYKARQLTEALDQRDELAAALRRYGLRHDFKCHKGNRIDREGRECTCGADAALKRAEETRAPEQRGRFSIGGGETNQP